MLSILVYVLLIIAPVIFWLWFFRSQDVYDEEPKAMIFKLFLVWGFLASFFTISLGLYLDKLLPSFGQVSESIIFNQNNVLSTAIIAGFFFSVIIEEFTKFIVLWIATYYSRYFTQVMDGVIYGISVALGFAFFENTVYYFVFLSKNLGGMELIINVLGRAVGPMIMHLITTGIVGLYLGRKKFSRDHSNRYVIKGLSIAIAIHVAFNFSQLFFDNVFSAVIPIIIVISGVAYLVREISKDENRMIWKLSFLRK